MAIGIVGFLVMDRNSEWMTLGSQKHKHIL